MGRRVHEARLPRGERRDFVDTMGTLGTLGTA
ncbi:hypothetical protein HDC93_005258 [Streptomyces sp. AK010]|nr:hypothetical protein [Streptomyces sp. AK010]